MPKANYSKLLVGNTVESVHYCSEDPRGIWLCFRRKLSWNQQHNNTINRWQPILHGGKTKDYWADSSSNDFQYNIGTSSSIWKSDRKLQGSTKLEYLSMQHKHINDNPHHISNHT